MGFWRNDFPNRSFGNGLADVQKGLVICLVAGVVKLPFLPGGGDDQTISAELVWDVVMPSASPGRDRASSRNINGLK